MKNLLTSILGIFLFIFTSHAQWIKKTDFGGDMRYAAKDFVINNNIYIVGGILDLNPGNIAYNDLWEYNVKNDHWTKKANYPGGEIWGGVAFTIDSLAYVGLGADKNGNQSNQLWAYNFRTDQWTQKANFPGSTRVHAFSFSVNGKGYVGCGQEFVNSSIVYLNDFWEYDPNSDTWTQKSNYPGFGLAGHVSFVIEDEAYIGMGDDGSFFYVDFYGYNPVTDSWSSIAPFPGSNRSFSNSAATNNGKGFILGGENNQSGVTNESWSYDPTADNWAPEFSFTGPARAAANFIYLNGSFFYGLGLTGNNTAIVGSGANDFWKYEYNVGLSEQNQSLVSNIYPNPTSGSLKIELDNSMNSEILVELLDIHGQIIDRWSFESTKQLDLNIDHPNGIYLLKTTINNTKNSYLIIKI